jgi:hypothetical protein
MTAISLDRTAARRLVRRLAIAFILAALCSQATLVAQGAASAPGTDLDKFMAVVLARRDENWRKLQQYVLDEHEAASVFGPGRARLYGLDREYTWFIKDGIFVRSPVRFDGVTLSERDRRAAEDEWLARHKNQPPPSAAVGGKDTGATTQNSSDADRANVDALLKLAREPEFVSAAYFMRFKFEPGRYAFVGPESYSGRQVYRIEYYPTRLFTGEDEGANKAKKAEEKDDPEARIERQMNKVALVTLWIEPETHQIVQYHFQNVGMDFLPGRSIVRVEGVDATMRMGQPFPGVWLPQGIEGRGRVILANGTYDAEYTVAYQNYREANVAVKVR